MQAVPASLLGPRDRRPATEARTTRRDTSPSKPSNAKWAKPMPKTRANFIPAQSWLGYNWIDKDPELDFVLACIEQSGWSLERIEAETEKNGHKVSRWTLMAWFYKGTRQPKNVTMNNVMAAIGWHRQWKQA
jgi:hypothetical protein